jgi:hypothetical protein
MMTLLWDYLIIIRIRNFNTTPPVDVANSYIMKKFILLAVMLLVGAFAAGAQTTKVSEKTTISGSVYTSSSSRASSSSDIKTGYTWNNEKEGVSYDIYLHKYTKGDKVGQWTCYVIRVSKKTGKEYKYYLPDGAAIAEDIIRRNPSLIKK